MQSRRHEDFATQSSVVRDRQTDMGHDRFVMPRSRRSLSPHTRMEGSHSHSQRVLLSRHNRRSISLERRADHVDASRRIRSRSRSPPFQGVKRVPPRYDDKDLPNSELQRRYEFFDYMDMNCDLDPSMRNDFGYKHTTTSRAIIDDSRLDGGRHGIMGQSQKSTVLEDGAGRGIEVYRLPMDVGPTSKYDERGGNFSSASVNLGLGQLRDERVRYPDPYLSEKLSAIEKYVEGEKPMFQLRGDPYSGLTASKSKESMGASHFNDFAVTSPRNSRIDYSGYRSGMPLPAEDYPRSSAKITEPLAHPGYGQRHLLDTGRDPDPEIKEDLARYHRDTFSPTRTGHRNYMHRQPRIRESDDYAYPSVDIYSKMNLRERVDYGRRDLLRPSVIDPVTDRVDNTELARGNLSNSSSLWDHHSLENQTAPNYIGLRRSPASSKQGGQYLDSASVHSRLGRKISSEQEIPYLGIVRDREMSHMRIDYDFNRDVGPESHEERMRNSPEFLYDTEMRRHTERTQRMEDEELVPYNSSNRVLKRKYSMEEEMSRGTSRTIMPSKWNTSCKRYDRDDRGEEWVGQDARGPIFTKRGSYAHRINRRMERTYDEADRYTDSASEDWFSSHDHAEFMQDHSSKSYKYGSKYSKGYSRPSSLSWYNSNHPNRRHVLPKRKNVLIRGEDDNEDVHTVEGKPSEAWVSSAKSEPPEDSEEFKQLVHTLFLTFTKKLNDNAVVRKRYEEQGTAGSLFCIVCGRSLSKEFMDTQRLATHAFMSHKVGLRAEHLGLHKAICVLLGWNSVVSPDVVTWFPETLSSAEALAQKEDLILWPPLVIIRNSSVSNSDSEGQGLVTVEALGNFLRGKGFGGGKVRMGRPANSSIMVVKFLGTFSGLQYAEKLHRYFAKNKRGRKEFEQIASGKGKSKSKSSNKEEGEMKGDEVNELVLYGYMGIAEDLDKVDFDTRRKCSIKSKKEIQDLMDAPVKPE